MKKYEFRKLTAADIFPLSTIISKLGVNKLKECFNPEALKAGETDASALGMHVAFDIAGLVLENAEKCENDIYNLLSKTSNLTAEEIKEMSPGDFMKMLVAFIQKEEFKDFFRAASQLFK